MSNVITNDDARDVVSGNLRQLLAEAGWTQVELVRRLNNGEATVAGKMQVSRWCNGDTLPSPADLCNIADALGCTTDRILRKSRRRGK